MLVNIKVEDRKKLEAWLLSQLAGASDADPQLLTEFVMALLSNAVQKKSDLTLEHLTSELSDFLEDNASSFSSLLLKTLADRSYALPTGPRSTSIKRRLSSPPPPAGPSKQARLSQHAPPTGPRLTSKQAADKERGTSESKNEFVVQPFVLQPNHSSGIATHDSTGAGRRAWQDMAVVGHGDMVGAAGPSGTGGYTRQKGLCWDYHERGYCARGVACPFEHSADSVFAPLGTIPGAGGPSVPNGVQVMNGMPQMPFFPQMNMGGGGQGNSWQGVATPPHGMGSPSSTVVPQQSNGPANAQRITQWAGGVSAGTPVGGPAAGSATGAVDAEGDIDMTTTTPGDEGGYDPSRPQQGSGGPIDGHDFMAMMAMGFNPMMGMNGGGGFPYQNGANNQQGGFRGGGRGGGRGRGGQGGMMSRGRGGMTLTPNPGQNDFNFGGRLSKEPPKDRNGNTLVISNVPPASMNMQAIRDHFKQFGNVTNIALEAQAKKALIAFETNAEAYAAWKSDEAVFGNRHVSVLWHRPMEGHGGKGAEALAASAPLLANMKKMEEGGAEAIQGNVIPAHQQAAQIQAKLDEARERQRTLERNLAESKVLMAKALDKTLDPEEVKAARTRLKQLAAENKAVTEASKGVDIAELEAVAERVKAAAELRAQAKRPVRVKEDAEAGIHSLSGMMEGVDGGSDDPVVLAALQAELEQMQKQARDAGIDPENPDADLNSNGGGYYRGRPIRGRGRANYRGARGGYNTGPRSLDNRTTAIALSGEGLSSDADLEAVKTFYERYGMNGPPFRKGDKIVTTFESQEAANKAMSLGTNIPGITGPIIPHWHAVAADDRSGGAELDEEMVAVNDDTTYKRGERGDDD